MQIQDAFDGTSLAALKLLGVQIYLKIPNFEECCPLCGGTGCAVRHGLYFRVVIDADGSVIERFPIPRFRCRRRGPSPSEPVTFSVLPTILVPRRRFSLPLMLLILKLVGQRQSIPQVLDDLAEREHGARGALLIEETTVFRLLSLFAHAYLGLGGAVREVIEMGPDPGGMRGRALSLAKGLLARGHSTGSSFIPVLRFHQKFFPRLLFDLHTR